MAYKTKKEKQAYKTGLLNGLKRHKTQKVYDSADQKAWRKNMLVFEKDGKVYTPSKTSKKQVSRNKFVKRRAGQASKNNPFGMSYHQLLKEEEMRKRDLFGDFDFDSRGRIKGSYIDGKFEPD